MSIWKWIVGRLSVTEGIEKWRMAFGYDYDSHEDVSANGALKLSVWWSASRLITETIATLPSAFYQKNGEDRIKLPDYFLQQLLNEQPNDEQTPIEFWEGRIGPLVMQGNSFAEKKFLGPRIVALQRMPFSDVQMVRRKDNSIIYKFTDRGKVTELPPEKVFHIKGFTPNDEDLGLSPVEYASRSIGAAKSVDKAAARVYSRGMRAQGFFTAPEDMTPAQRTEFQKNYIDPGEGAANEGKTLIFPPKMDWKNMNITPRDAEMILTRGFNVEDVCRWMRVPPILVGHSSAGQTMWGTGVEQIILGWLVLGLRAYLKRIESAVNNRLVPLADRRNGIYFEFNFEGLLRADSAARAQLMAQLAQNGLRTRDELRRIDNYGPVPGGDTITVQSNLVPLDKLGEQQQGAEQIRQSLKAWLDDERKIA